MVSAFSETSALANSFTLAWDTSSDDIDIRQAGISQQFTGLCRGSAFDDYARQTGASFECTVPDALHTVGNSYTRQSAATGKRIISYACYAGGYRHRRQTVAIGECTAPDACYAGGYRHRRKSAATGKRIISYACHGRIDFCFYWLLDPSWWSAYSTSFRHQPHSHQCRTVHCAFYQVFIFQFTAERYLRLRAYDRF